MNKTLSIVIALLSIAITIKAQTPNIDFETGTYAEWKYYTGSCCPIVTPTGGTSTPTTGRHTLVTGTGIDPYGGFPEVSPWGGIYSLKLGNNINGAQGERARYYVHVPSTSTSYSVIFHYAVVLCDPLHAWSDQTRMEMRTYDSATGAILPCDSFTYVARAGLAGFTTSSLTGPGGVPIYCRDWSMASIDLRGHAGRTIVVDFAVGDCDLGGHWGYGYIDMQKELFANIIYVPCAATTPTVTLTAPYGYTSYSWRDSATFSIVYGTTRNITVPATGVSKTYAVILTPYAGYGCNDTLYTRVIDSSIVGGTAALPGRKVCVGDTVIFTASGIGTWSSSAPLIATIGATSGIVTGISSGVAAITYTLATGCTYTSSVTVNTTPAIISGDTVICVGSSGSAFNIIPGGTWSSSSPSIASIGSGGAITGHAPGVAVISYTLPGGCYKTKTITVNPLPSSVVISLDPDKLAFCVGDIIGLHASISGGFWSIVSGHALLAGSTLTAVTPGTDTVLYVLHNICGSYTASRVFTVLSPPPVPYGDLTVCMGDTIVLKDSLPGGTFSGGWPQVVYFFPDSCMVIGYIASTAIISYTMPNGCKSVVEVTVNPWPREPLFYESLDLCIGAVKILTNTPAGGIWYSSDTTTATIGIDGRIIAKDTGRTVISYTTPPNSYGCTTIDTFQYDVILPNFAVTGTITNVLCYGDANGKIELNKLGANILCRYLWSTGATTPAVQNLAVGTYTVTVTDTNTQCMVAETFTVAQPDSLMVTSTMKKDICQSGKGSITLSVSGGTSPYTYAWSNGKTIKDPDAITAGSYNLLLKDVNGCSENLSILVEDTCAGIVVYNGVSPNGDGINDTWIIEGIQQYPASEVQVYDKWGDMVFSKTGYNNDWNGGQMPDGTYFYLIKLNTANGAGGKDTFTGSLLIKR